jgi:tripartite-type tricarboxylate transporter receptor subunit TctC
VAASEHTRPARIWSAHSVHRLSARIVEKLNKEINAGLAAPKIKARLADLSGTALPSSPAEFGKLIADETEKWAKVVRAAHIKAQ